MKKSSLYVALFAALGLSTMAHADDMADQIFGETISGEIHVLSDEEMESTQGEWGPYGAYGGAAMGGLGYMGGAITTGQWSWPLFTGAVAAGGLSGFSGGPASWYYTSRGSFAIGAAAGSASTIW